MKEGCLLWCQEWIVLFAIGHDDLEVGIHLFEVIQQSLSSHTACFRHMLLQQTAQEGLGIAKREITQVSKQ
jgi:hypothetical protein